MAEPGIGELSVIHPNLSWEEIIKRGGFESQALEELGPVPNPDSFHILPPDTKAHGVLNLDNPAASEGLSPSFIPTIEEILAVERKRGTPIEDMRFFWNRAGRGNRQPHTDEQPPYGNYPSKRHPADVIRWTAGTDGGTSGYPGYYDLSTMSLSDDKIRNEDSASYQALIASQAKTKERITTPALTIARFRGLDVHGPPPDNELNENRVLFSLTAEPRSR